MKLTLASLFDGSGTDLPNMLFVISRIKEMHDNA